MPRPTKLFLSAVNAEFESDRQLLVRDLKRPNLVVGVEEDFINSGGSTLEKLDDDIRRCDAVIQLVGKATGSEPEEPAVEALGARGRAGLRLVALQRGDTRPGLGIGRSIHRRSTGDRARVGHETRLRPPELVDAEQALAELNQSQELFYGPLLLTSGCCRGEMSTLARRAGYDAARCTDHRDVFVTRSVSEKWSRVVVRVSR